MVEKTTDDKIFALQSKVNNNIIMLIKKINKRLDFMQKEIDDNWRKMTYYQETIISLDERIKKLEKDNEIDLGSIKVGLNDD